MKPVIGLVGTGVIGTGWAIRALARGWPVVASDSAAGAEERLQAGVERAWPAARRLGLFPGADPGQITWLQSASEVAAAADFIQESVPEDLGIKQGVHLELDAAADQGVVIASSSSGLLPSKMQAGLAHPDRFVVGHPFNPVYLLPLVEVVPGQDTSDSSVEFTTELYRDMGMHPLLVRNEIEGYLSDRLQESMWREILHLVKDGVATTDELDQAIVFGPGLRWAGMGTNLTFHLAGGEEGITHMLEQFGPALQLPWTHLEAPELTEELKERLAEGTAAQADGRSVEELERLRDDYLVSVMRALRPHNVGAGPVLSDREASIQRHQPAVWAPGDGVPVPLRLYSCAVEPEWVDYNGHMTESAYLLSAGWATDALFRYLGIDDGYRAAGHSYYTVESHIRFLREVSLEQHLLFETTVLGADEKRLHFVHMMIDDISEERLASVEQMLVHVDIGAGKSSPAQPGPAAALEAIVEAHAAIDPPVTPTMRVG